MTEKPPPELDDKTAEDRFNKTLERLLGTPHKPHKVTEKPKPSKG